MKLSQIYSNQKKFKPVRFQDGLNVIVGKVHKEEEMDRDTHNLGKTTLVNLIDFMLLKKVNQSSNSFLVKHATRFADYVFYLEIKLNSNSFITIRRAVAEFSKVSLKFHKIGNQNYVNEPVWDYTDLLLNSTKIELNPRLILNEKLNFNVLTNYDYRKTLNYLLRTQADYNDVFHLNKFKGPHKDWKPLLFELLGFYGNILEKKYYYDDLYSARSSFIKNSKRNFSINPEEFDKIKGAIQIKEAEKVEYQNKIDMFSFYMEEKNLNTEVLTGIESKISDLNSEVYKTNFEIEKLKKSRQNEIKFDPQEVEKLFNEVNIYFPDNLKKNYEDLLEFNKQISEERDQYINEQLKNLSDNLTYIQSELIALDNKRVEILGAIKEKDTFKKFKYYQSELLRIDNDIAELKNKLNRIKEIEDLNLELKKIKYELNAIINNIKETVGASNELYDNIRVTFNSFAKRIFNQPALISISINDNDNVDFKADVSDISNNKITSKGDGNTYKKLLCAIFDLSILVNYTQKNFYRFVYHDGILEGLDNRTKIKYIELIKEVISKYDVQYILTLIEHDAPTGKEKDRIMFDKSEIVLTLDDRKGDEGKLFEMSF